MHKLLLAMLMALLLTLALVGVKRIAQGNHTASADHKTMIAEGTMPPPPIPW